MDLIPLAKVSCLLLVTGYYHLTFTSPNPPASEKNRQFVPSIADRILKGAVTIRALDYVKAYLWCSALAESAVIFANAYPSLPISYIIHEKLLFGGDGNQIRFTKAAAVAIPLGIAGGVLRAWCYQELGKYFTFEMSMMKDHALVTTGPYSTVRHPSYAGAVMVIISVFLLHGTKGSWARESGLLRYTLGKIGAALLASILGTIVYAALWRMKEEDRELRRRFGEKWDTWATKVRYLIIPGVI